MIGIAEPPVARTILSLPRREEALHELSRAVQRSGRKQQVPFAKEFLQDPSGNPPLARLVQGGRGGEVRLKIYLTVTLLGPPARLTQITLLNSTLTGEQYVRPLAKGSHYISLPLGLWHQGWILDLSATELALLMVLIDVQKASDQPRYVTGQDRLRTSAHRWSRVSINRSTCFAMTFIPPTRQVIAGRPSKTSYFVCLFWRMIWRSVLEIASLESRLAPVEHAYSYLDRYRGDAELEVVEGDCCGWGSVPAAPSAAPVPLQPSSPGGSRTRGHETELPGHGFGRAGSPRWVATTARVYCSVMTAKSCMLAEV
ncbi:hypothetical protein [Amycolatopsis thermoflava]|nr:hypothetical protein [Amycolatopsis thermoflava]